jgi:hypothetical protein
VSELTVPANAGADDTFWVTWDIKADGAACSAALHLTLVAGTVDVINNVTTTKPTPA